MKKMIGLFVVSFFIGVAIAYATLPADLVARMYQSYVETSEGNVAVRVVFEN